MTSAQRRSATSRASTADIYQLKVTSRGIRPPVWHRVQVPGDYTLHRLHQVIQTVMGWYDAYLHEFRVGGVSYAEPDDQGWGLPVRDDRRYKLRDLAPRAGSNLTYQYDFGDDWQHAIVVESILLAGTGVPYPRCIKGVRACPPEDCGGPWGYRELLEILEDPNHSVYEERIEWLGGPIDPEAFDVDAVNEALRRPYVSFR